MAACRGPKELALPVDGRTPRSPTGSGFPARAGGRRADPPRGVRGAAVPVRGNADVVLGFGSRCGCGSPWRLARFADLDARVREAREEARPTGSRSTTWSTGCAPSPVAGAVLLFKIGFGAETDLPLDLPDRDGDRSCPTADLLDEATVDRMLGHYEHLLADALTRPHGPSTPT